MKKYNIHLYHTYSALKAAIAERVIRTLKTNFEKYFYKNDTFKWIDVLDNIVDEYNKTFHTKIRMAPVNVDKKKRKNVVEYCI